MLAHVLDLPHRPPVARVLADAVSELDDAVAELPQSAHLGRVLGGDVIVDKTAVLVRGARPLSSDDARQGKVALRASDLRRDRVGMARLGHALAAVRNG